MDNTYELIIQAKNGSKNAMSKLIEENYGLIYSIAKRFFYCGYDREDLVQIGTMGFIKAVNNFDISLDLKLSTYAYTMISGEIKRFLRDNGPIKISRRLKMIYLKYKIEMERYYKEEGKECSINNMAEILDISSEELLMAINANESVTSIDKPINNNDGSQSGILEKIENPKINPENYIERLSLSMSINSLEADYKKIIKLRYFENKTQSETGKILGMSQVSVSRLEKKILKIIREKINWIII